LRFPKTRASRRYQFAANQIKADFDIWSDVFSAQPSRLIRVVAGMAANPTGVTEPLLQNMDGKFDAVSVTGYFGLSSGQRASFNSSTTGADIAKAVMANVPSAISGLRDRQSARREVRRRAGDQDVRIRKRASTPTRRATPTFPTSMRSSPPRPTR